MTPPATGGRRPPASGAARDRVVYDVVVPTVGRPSLRAVLEALGSAGPDDPCAPGEVLVVDDRGPGAEPLRDLPAVGGRPPRVVVGGGRGPAAARNLGWRVSTAPWVAFFDDDVLPRPGWTAALVEDLRGCDEATAASQGRVVVPRPAGRPTDWTRSTAGLETARWITADMAYRRAALRDVGGFDERFPRAYREDADLALRVQDAGWRLVHGRRCTDHPVRPADDRVSLRVQAGNADDVLMRRLHGPHWRQRADAPPGRFRWHAATAGAAAWAGVALLTRSPRTAGAAAACWAGLTLELLWRRLGPGPRPWEPGGAAEWRRMLTTTPLLPFAAVRHRLAGQWRHRHAEPWPPRLRAVLLDRDGTLVHDEPYNGDPDLVRPVDGAADAVRRLRAAGLRVGVVTNQSGIGRGLLTSEQVAAVNARVDVLLGPFDTWQVCPHAPEDGCGCRKPRPGMVLRAAAELGVRPDQCAVVGDIGADVLAALAAGARAVLVPTPVTRREEVHSAPEVAPTLAAAVDLLLGAPATGDAAERVPARQRTAAREVLR